MKNIQSRSGPWRLQWLLLAALGLLLAAISTWAAYSILTSRAPIIVWDFHPPWLALRAMLREGADPYGTQVSTAIQHQMLGRSAYPGEDQFAFVYPLPVMAIIGPLTLLPLPLAQAIWLSLLGMTMTAFALLAPRAVDWHPPLYLLALTVLCTLGLHSDLWALVLGQLSILVAAFVVLTWWALKTRLWRLAGVFLALATVKPQMVFLFVPAVLAWAIRHRRWHVVSSFALCAGFLFLLPMPWLPDWPLAWLNAMHRYAGYTSFESPLAMWLRAPWAVGFAAAALIGWTWFCGQRTSQYQPFPLDWTLSMALVVGVLIAPRSSNVNQLVLLLPLFFVFSQVPRVGFVVTVEVLLLVGLWTLDLVLSPESSLEKVMWQQRVINPILPAGLILALLYLSPRTARRAI
jgi:hypothetical protein